MQLAVQLPRQAANFICCKRAPPPADLLWVVVAVVVVFCFGGNNPMTFIREHTDCVSEAH